MKPINYLFLIFFSILCWVSHLLIATIGGNLIYRYIGYGVICFFIPLFLFFKYINFSRKVLCFIIIPLLFNLLVSIHSTLKGGYTLPLGLIGVISVITAYYISKYYKKHIILNSFLFLFCLIISSYLYANWVLGWKKEITNERINKNIIIKNQFNQIVDLSKASSKVIVLDLWSSTCGVCFKEFPKFEKQYLKYKKDPKVELYSLNLPLRRDTSINIKAMINNYKFAKLYAQGLDSWEKLNVKSVPLIVILDKKGTIRFKGSMNTNKYMFYNNFNSLIEKLKNE